MTLHLVRHDFLETGIFGHLTDDEGKISYFTLEHSYVFPSIPESEDDGLIFVPKMPPGTYTCVRGEHQLVGMKEPFTTFEITGVPDHTGILFHIGNTNEDSDGCVLVGVGLIKGLRIVNSRQAFLGFLKATEGLNQFQLIVT